MRAISADRARVEIAAEIDSFLDDNAVGRGIHYASPLELAMRALHWLGAVELAGGAAAFPRRFVERLGGALLADGCFLAAHLEDRGIVPANHLLGDYVGLWALGLALDGAPHARDWQALAARGLAVQAARQVGRDGAHFEASTAYHRFALELMLAAHLWARAADRPSPVGETLHRMLVYLRHYVGPDGCEPAFGDGDDARLYPIVPRPPRHHAYLLPVGAALFGDPELRAERVPFSEEALWLGGPAARRVWAWLPPTRAPSSASFPTGGVHILRSAGWQVELRSGSYGQRGIGGHAHNDQLSLVAWLDGAPLVVDTGTGSYAADMVLRDRFRGTAAHSTVVVDGQEQSPILLGRPFALPDVARAPRVRLEDQRRARHPHRRALGLRAATVPPASPTSGDPAPRPRGGGRRRSVERARRRRGRRALAAGPAGASRGARSRARTRGRDRARARPAGARRGPDDRPTRTLPAGQGRPRYVRDLRRCRPFFPEIWLRRDASACFVPRAA